MHLGPINGTEEQCRVPAMVVIDEADFELVEFISSLIETLLSIFHFIPSLFSCFLNVVDG